MPETGIEPVRVLPRRILSPVRLPVPPLGQSGWGRIRTFEAIATDLQSAPFGHSGTQPYHLIYKK